MGIHGIVQIETAFGHDRAAVQGRDLANFDRHRQSLGDLPARCAVPSRQ